MWIIFVSMLRPKAVRFTRVTFSWPATYNSFASRGVAVCEEDIIYKCISIHSFSEHVQSEPVRLLTFQEKLFQISYMFLWLESEAVTVDNLWVPKSRATVATCISEPGGRSSWLGCGDNISIDTSLLCSSPARVIC